MNLIFNLTGIQRVNRALKMSGIRKIAQKLLEIEGVGVFFL